MESRTPETIETMREKLYKLEEGGFFTDLNRFDIEQMGDWAVVDWIKMLAEVLKPV